MIEGLVLEAATDGTVLSVRVRPGARENAVTGVHDGALKVQVAAKPKDGDANAALIRYLARDVLGIAQSDVVLRAGGHSRVKRIFVRLPPKELLHRLALVC